MAANGTFSIPRQKSKVSTIKSPPSARKLMDTSKPSEPLNRTSSQTTMIRTVTISVLKAENPQLAHLFDSNYAPSDSELETICQHLKAAKAEQLKYKHIKPPGRYAYNQDHKCWTFRHNLQQIDNTIAYWKSLLAPIRRIPPEILIHIFSCLVPLEVPANFWTYHRRMRPRVEAPFVLLYICQQWRVLALSTRSLWKRLPDVSLREVKLDLAERRLARLSKCADLAKQDFSMYIRGPRWELGPLWQPEWASVGEEFLPLFLDFLYRTSHFWAECTVSAPDASLECLRGIKGKTPNLRELTLFFGNRSGDPGPAKTYIMDLFEHAPLLRRLHIAGPHDGHIIVPMDRLTHLKDHSIGEHASIRLLRSPVYPDLVYLELTDRPIGSSAMLKFPRLQHFQIHCRIDIAAGCMSRTQFPSLVKLVVLAEDASGDILGVIQRATVRSECTTIQSFSVYYNYNTDQHYRRTSISSVLGVMPNLSQLDLIANPTDIPDLANFYCQEKQTTQICNIYIGSPIRGSTAAALQKLSMSLSSCMSDKHTLKICTYKSLPLYDPPHRPMVTPAMLELWFTDPRKSILHDLSVKLRATGPGRQVCASECYRVNLDHDTLESRQELFDILSRVESYRPINVDEILVSNIQFVISRLTVQAITVHDDYRPSKLARNRFYSDSKAVYLQKFKDQLLRIMKQWHKILMNESLDTIHWTWSSASNKLEFVSSNASVRGDKQRWASTILGMPELHLEA